MELVLNKATFKAQAKKQHTALKNRIAGTTVKLSDIQESLAIAYGYENLATMYAALAKAESRFVYNKDLMTQKDNLFVVSFFWPDSLGIESDSEDEIMCVFPPGTTINHVASRDWCAVQTLRTMVKPFDEGFCLSEETTVFENYAQVPRIEKYGLPDSANEATAVAWVQDWLGFRAPKAGVGISVSDTGDESSNQDNLLIWVSDSDAEKIRAMFA